MVLIASASPKSSFTSFTKLKIPTARVAPYLSPSAVSRNAFLKDSLDLAAIIFPFISIIDIASISSLLDKTSSAILSAALDVTTMMVSLTSCNKNYYYYYYCHRQQRGLHITINCSRIKFIFLHYRLISFILILHWMQIQVFC